MSKNIVFEGWLTKSPPIKRIWRTKWRRRWFALRQGELPGQYFLDYYADRNCRRLKGTINLDLCEQVDAGLHMERSGHGIDPKLRGSVFTIQTQSRTYHLEADCEAEMQKWVDAICRVCGLRATDEVPVSGLQNIERNIRNNISPTPEACQYPGPYIPISECITGIRAQGSNRFTFDAQNIEELTNNKFEEVCLSQPRLVQPVTDLSDNESNISEDECKSLNTSQSNMQDWTAEKSFTKLKISDSNKQTYSPEDVPPVPPPRPPKTFLAPYQGPKILEPNEIQDALKIQDPATTHRMSSQSSPRQRTLQRQQHVTSTSPSQQPPTAATNAASTSSSRQGPVAASASGNRPQPASSNFGSRLQPAAAPHVSSNPGSRQHQDISDEEDDIYSYPSLQYINLALLPPEAMPPIVDRALKPRNHGTGHSTGETVEINRYGEPKSESLQYLDLDLAPSQPTTSKAQVRKKVVFAPDTKSLSDIETESVYKTVDFLKTEAFNSTRQDAEALRSQPMVNILSN